MLRLELEDQEQEALVDVLKSFLSELRSEVVHTDSHAYREGLKAQEQLLKKILVKVEQRA